MTVATLVDIRAWTVGAGGGPFDAREIAAACSDFAQRVPRIDANSLFCYRSQCTSGPFAGRLISVIENELLLRAQTPASHADLLRAIEHEFFKRDPQLSVLIMKIRSLMRGRYQKIWDELKNNFPMDKMTAGAACVMTGVGLIFVGWQNRAVATTTKNASQYEDGTFQICVGTSILVAPVANAVYHGLRGGRA